MTNPLPARPARGETDAAIRLFAATGFRAQARGVTPEDWERIACADPLVAAATAEAAAIGGGPCRIGLVTRPDDAAVLGIVRDRLLGEAVLGAPPTVRAAEDVPLDIALVLVCRPGTDIAATRRDLAQSIGTGHRPDGTPAFFHPASWPLGRDVLLAELVAVLARMPQIAAVQADPALDPRTRFERADAPGSTPANVAAGRIALRPEERARVANDPRDPGSGRILLYLVAGP